MNDNNHEKTEEINDPAYYAIIPSSVRYHPKLSPNEKLLYGEITALANQRGYCFATNGYFAKLYGVAKGTVSKWVSNLEKEGFIITFDHIIATGTQRRIKLGVDEKLNPPTRKDAPPYTKKDRGMHEKLNHNNTVNNTANTNIKIGSANFLDITAYFNTKVGQTIYSAVIANLKDAKITEDEFLADLKKQYAVYEFKDDNHVINALNRRIELIEANKKKVSRRESFNPPQNGMVY